MKNQLCNRTPANRLSPTLGLLNRRGAHLSFAAHFRASLASYPNLGVTPFIQAL